MPNIVPYKHYSYFDTSGEAIYTRRMRHEWKMSQGTPHDKELAAKNLQKLSEIFSVWFPYLLSRHDKGL